MGGHLMSRHNMLLPKCKLGTKVQVMEHFVHDITIIFTLLAGCCSTYVHNVTSSSRQILQSLQLVDRPTRPRWQDDMMFWPKTGTVLLPATDIASLWLVWGQQKSVCVKHIHHHHTFSYFCFRNCGRVGSWVRKLCSGAHNHGPGQVWSSASAVQHEGQGRERYCNLGWRREWRSSPCHARNRISWLWGRYRLSVSLHRVPIKHFRPWFPVLHRFELLLKSSSHMHIQCAGGWRLYTSNTRASVTHAFHVQTTLQRIPNVQSNFITAQETCWAPHWRKDVVHAKTYN